MISAYPPHPAGEAAPHPAAVWLDLKNPGEGEVGLVEELAGVRLPTRAELREIELSSRLAFEGGMLRLTAPMISKAETDRPELAYVGLVLTPQRLITVHYAALKIFEMTADEVAAAPHTPSSADIFLALMQSFVARQADLLEAARARLDTISHRVFREHSNAPRHARRSNAIMRDKLRALGALGERTSMIRESLLAVDRMIPFALASARDWFGPDLAAKLGVVREDISALSQFEEHLLGKIQFLLDAVLGFINIEQNDIFKVLTIASVVGIFPTLVAGWYGMNFQHMPELSWAWGYQYGIGVIVASTILPLLWFKWRGWL
jgi:magnesium transporter